MPSTYSTTLGIELMVTGEKSGQWGNITNTNLQLIEQGISGYLSKSIAGGAQTTNLTITDGSLASSDARNFVIELTGTITGNQIVTVPNGIEKSYIFYNNTTGSFTVQVKTVSGTGPTFATTDKGYKLVYSDGTNLSDVPLGVPGGSDTQVQFNDGGSFGGSSNLTWDDTNLTIGSAQGDLRLTDDDQSHYVALQAGAMSANATFTLPTADGTSGQVLQTNGSGALSFTDPAAGGASWQAVITADPANAVAGNGYFCNTTSGAFTVTLPTSASIGDFISFIDYAGTFDTNNLTIGRNGHNIAGSANDLVVSVERAGFTLVYVDSTQGWLLANK